MLSENSLGRWGEMNVCQMLRHCDLVLQVALRKVELPRINVVYKTIGIFTKAEMYVFNNGIPPAFSSDWFLMHQNHTQN
jgi:hypothetical protein